MKIAFFTPLYPVKSGISHYSEVLLHFLQNYLDIDVFIDDYEPLEKPRGKLGIYSFRDFEKRLKSEEYALQIYQMGNNSYHFYMYPFIIQYPGIVVMHDFVLHHSFAGMTVVEGDRKRYIEEMRYDYGETGVMIAEMRFRNIFTELQQFVYPLNKRIIDSGVGIIVHNEYARKKILEYNPAKDVKKINMGILPPEDMSANKRDLKRKLGIPDNNFVIGVFGFVNAIKRVNILIEAFKTLRKEYPDIFLLIVGEIAPQTGIVEKITEYSLESSVKIAGFVPEDDFSKYILASDVAVNLRYPTAGETSASMLRIMSMGVPVVLSNYRQFAEMPDNCCIKIDLGKNEISDLHNALKGLLSNKTMRKEIGENAAAYISKDYSPEGAAKAYFDFIDSIYRKRKVLRKILNEAMGDEEWITLSQGDLYFKKAASELGIVL